MVAGKTATGPRALSGKMFTMVLIGIVIIELLILTKEIFDIGRAGNTAAETGSRVAVPIILYHSILTSDKITDRYAVTPAEFENDLKYIRDNGYTTITMNDLAGYVYDNRPLPEKPIVITFDDGFLNTYVYAFPLLQKYDMKAVLSVIGSYADTFTQENSDNLVYSHATWDQIEEMHESGRFEIQNHSYFLHSSKKGRVGARKTSGETLEQYEKVLTEDIGELQKKIAALTGYTPSTFVYPYGEISGESVPILKKMGFKASLSTYGGVNYITKDPDALFGLKRNDRPRGMSSRVFFKRVYEV